MGFLQQFLEVFQELKGSNFFVTGESVSVLPGTFLSNARLIQSDYSMLECVSMNGIDSSRDGHSDSDGCFRAIDVPYIANWIYEHPGELDLDLKGIWIADPTLSYGFIQQDIPALRFAQVHTALRATTTQNADDAANGTIKGQCKCLPL